MAIRVVVAFGQEKTEIKNYCMYLDNSRKASTKTHLKNAASLCLMMMMIYWMYAYSFWIGTVWVEKQFWNHGSDRPYSGGDTIGVFFSVIIGLFSISMISSQ